MFTYQFSNDYTLTLTDDGEVDSNLSSGGFVLDSDYFSGRHTHEALVEAVKLLRDQRAELDAAAKAAAAAGTTDLTARIAELEAWVDGRDQTIRGFHAQVAQQRDQLFDLRATVAEHETWKDKLVQDAHAYANRQDWCSEFDNFMDDHDLPRRSTDYNVEVQVRYTATLAINAVDADDAREQAHNQLQDSSYFPSTIRIGTEDIQLSERDSEVLDVEAD